MKITAVSTIGKLTLAGALALLFLPQAGAEDRTEVLERIAPIGKVSVAGEAAPAPAEEPAPAAAAEPASADAVPAAAATEETAPVEAAATEATAAAEAAAPAAAGADPVALATASGCMGCHQLEAKVVGPAYKEVSAKYQGDAGALDMLVTKVKAGGVGTWGQIPMPPNAHVSEEDIRTIVTWVLSL